MLLLVAGALIALALAVQAASAGESRIVRIDRATTVQFEDLPGSTGDRVFGQLSIRSGQARLATRCLAGQTVLIRHTLTKPGGGSPPATLIATVKTDAQGAWESTGFEAAGAAQVLYDTFHIEAPKHRLSPKGVSPKRVCLGATNFITVPSA